MNCIIVDDEEISRKILAQLIQQVDYLKLLRVCNDPIDGLKALQSEKIDLLFLDVEMPRMNGLDLLKSLDVRPLVIMTTSHKEYACDAFEFNVVDYLVKPVDASRFMKAVTKARDYGQAKNGITSLGKEFFFIKSNSVLTKLLYKDVLWVEALGDYLTIHTPQKKYIIHMTLKAIETKLSPEKFVRVHRSFIVGIENITSVDDTTIYINNKPIPVGALYRENFMKRLNLLS